MSMELLNREIDYQSLLGLKNQQQNLVQALLLILIVANMFVHELNFSTRGNEMILNLKCNLSKKRFNINDNNSWKVIPEQYFK